MKLKAVSVGADCNKGGSIHSGRRIPKSINSNCPHCSREATFSIVNIFPAISKEIAATAGLCPACGGRVLFTLYYDPSSEAQDPVDISMFPSPNGNITAIELPHDLAQPLKRAIRDAEECFRAGLYSPALSSAGRAMEGLLKHISPAKPGTTLNDLIKGLGASDEVAKPINMLAHTIREGRNVAAHFDEKFTPDQETAELMIELLHHFIAYFFLFGQKADQLKSKIASDPRTD